MLTELFNNVDKFGTSFVTQTYQSLAANLTGEAGGVDILTLLLVLYLIFWGVGIWAGTAQGSIVEIVYRLFRVIVIYTLATSWGDFDEYVYKFSQAVPSAIGNALLSTVSANYTGNSANLNDVNGVQNALDNMFNSAMNTINAFTQYAGLTNPGPYVLAGVFFIAMCLLIGFAAFLIILAKMFMWLLLALAPIFIVLMLYGYTHGFFQGWIRVIINFIIVQVLVYAMVAFFIVITQTVFDKINQANDDYATSVAYVLSGTLVAIIGFLLLTQIITVAQNISGALGFGAPSFGQFYRSGFIEPARFLGRASRSGAIKTNTYISRGFNTYGIASPFQRMAERSFAKSSLKSQVREGSEQASLARYRSSQAFRDFEAKMIKRYTS